MPSQKDQGTACSIYSEIHHLPAMYTSGVYVSYMYTLGYNPQASCIHGYNHTSVRMHSTSNLDYVLIVVDLMYA